MRSSTTVLFLAAALCGYFTSTDGRALVLGPHRPFCSVDDCPPIEIPGKGSEISKRIDITTIPKIDPHPDVPVGGDAGAGGEAAAGGEASDGGEASAGGETGAGGERGGGGGATGGESSAAGANLGSGPTDAGLAADDDATTLTADDAKTKGTALRTNFETTGKTATSDVITAADYRNGYKFSTGESDPDPRESMPSEFPGEHPGDDPGRVAFKDAIDTVYNQYDAVIDKDTLWRSNGVSSASDSQGEILDAAFDPVPKHLIVFNMKKESDTNPVGSPDRLFLFELIHQWLRPRELVPERIIQMDVENPDTIGFINSAYNDGHFEGTIFTLKTNTGIPEEQNAFDTILGSNNGHPFQSLLNDHGFAYGNQQSTSIDIFLDSPPRNNPIIVLQLGKLSWE